MAKSSRQHILPRATARPVTAADVAHTFPFKASMPTGGALPEEDALYTQDVLVDPKTGRRFPQEAVRAARERMHASVRGRRDRLTLDDSAETQETTDQPAGVLGAPPSLTPEFDVHVEREVERRIAERQKQTASTMTPTRPPPAAEAAPGVAVRSVTIEDVDRLWDWVRADGDNGAAFLSRPMQTSMDLHGVMETLLTAESAGTALIRAIYYEGAADGDQHLGFAALAPILPVEQVAVMHIYLRPEVRGQLAQLTGPLIQLASSLLPTYTLAVLSADAAWARLHRQVLAPLGFVEQVLFVRRATPPVL